MMRSSTPLLDAFCAAAAKRGDLIAAARWGVMRAQATPSFRVLDARFPTIPVWRLAA